jgi:hypothetical protein
MVAQLSYNRGRLSFPVCKLPITEPASRGGIEGHAAESIRSGLNSILILELSCRKKYKCSNVQMVSVSCYKVVEVLHKFKLLFSFQLLLVQNVI